MERRVLAGDIGGTKTNLALYAVEGARHLRLLRERSFPSRDYPGLEAVLEAFAPASEGPVASAAFGIAGPVIDNVVQTTNLPWTVEAVALARSIGCARVRLMNDLETTSYGALFLPEDELRVLQPGVRRRGNIAVIAAGTGLGQGFLFWEGGRHHPVATEGGHADFAPGTEIEIELLRFLTKIYGHVSVERVLSGPGLHNIFRFLVEGLGRGVEAAVRERLRDAEDAGAVIGAAGTSGECATCAEAVGLFVGIYGAQAGNLALAGLAVGGVYVGGGIVIRMLPRIESGAFIDAFRSKGRYERMMSEIPVYAILNAKTSLIGAGHAASELLP